MYTLLGFCMSPGDFYIPHIRGRGLIVFGADPVDVGVGIGVVVGVGLTLSCEPVVRFIFMDT